MDEPLDIVFHRTGGPAGARELETTFRDVALSPEDDRLWLGPDHPARRPPGELHRGEYVYELRFRRGGERRTVVIADSALTTALRRLVDELSRLADP
jgi:hypothetical protein